MDDHIKDAMVSHEKSQLRVKLAAAQREFDDLDVLVSGGIIRIREIVNPYEDDVTKIDVDQAYETVERLRSHVHKMRDLLKTINRLKAAIGEQ